LAAVAVVKQPVIAVASGKGGTGKTTVAVGLALISGPVLLLDCDVEEPNAHLFLSPALSGRQEVSIPVPEIDDALCNRCGRCVAACQFHALALMGKQLLVFPELCHGCGACKLACPEQAIREVPRIVGEVESGKAGEIDFVHGRLNVGEPMATPVIRAVKNHLKASRPAIIDAAPGTACPVVEAVKGSDFCLLVTEPTPFGLSDLTLAVEVMEKLSLPCGVVINRSGSGDEATEQFCREKQLPLIGKIPFSREAAEAYARGHHPAQVLPQFRQALEQINHRLMQTIADAQS